MSEPQISPKLGERTSPLGNLPGMPTIPPRPKSPEVWSSRDLRGPIDKVIEMVQANETIPEEDKSWLVRKIKKSGFAGVIVDMHEHFHEGATIINGSIVRLY
jgi:hypothetical protein